MFAQWAGPLNKLKFVHVYYYWINHNHYNFLNVIVPFAALLYTNHSVQLLSDSVVGQLAVIGHL